MPAEVWVGLLNGDTGKLTLLGDCCGCGLAFEFNHENVPSLLIDRETGLPPDVGGTDPANATREPLCNACVKTANVRRKKAGLPLWPTSKDSSR
jgi:hypothetical protein